MLVAKQIGCCLTLTVAILAGDAVAQGPRSNSKTITWQYSQNSQDVQIGILGEIAKPGVYRTAPDQLSIQSLVRRAGGLTEDASLSIRIVRQERIVQNLFFSPQADSRLLPGDVLVVESRRVLSAMSKVLEGGTNSNSIRQVAGDPSDPTGVQVAYVNVLDAPVVVKLHSEDARLERVVQMLGQPIELAGAVKVIHPERATNGMAQIASGTLRLTDGTVLIFPKGTINRGKLPAFPKPYDSEIAVGARPGMIGGALGQAPELRSVGEMAPLIALPGQEPGSLFNNVNSPSIVAPSEIPIAPAVPTFDPEPAPAGTSVPVVGSRPRIATLPFTGTAHMRSSSNRGVIESDSVAPPPQDEPQPPTKATRRGVTPSLSESDTQFDTFSDDTELSVPSDSLGVTPFSALQMLGMLAGVSTLIGLAILARRHFEKQTSIGHRSTPMRANASGEPLASSPPPTQQESSASLASSASTIAEPAIAPNLVLPTSPPHQATLPDTVNSQEHRLERLIRNELPMREEAIEFPESLLLQGRIAPRPIHRIDRAVETTIESGPHFHQAIATMDASQLELNVHSSEQDRRTGPHFGMRTGSARPITIGEAQRAAAAIPVAVEPGIAASTTPLADALRQLQGDRPS